MGLSIPLASYNITKPRVIDVERILSAYMVGLNSVQKNEWAPRSMPRGFEGANPREFGGANARGRV